VVRSPGRVPVRVGLPVGQGEGSGSSPGWHRSVNVTERWWSAVAVAVPASADDGEPGVLLQLEGRERGEVCMVIRSNDAWEGDSPGKVVTSLRDSGKDGGTPITVGGQEVKGGHSEDLRALGEGKLVWGRKG
jgi:hypothetical protein